jgi:hypothetical protein
MAAAKIFGVEILNEGWGSSIDDAVSEMLGMTWPVRWANAGCSDLVLLQPPSFCLLPLSLPEKTAIALNL